MFRRTHTHTNWSSDVQSPELVQLELPMLAESPWRQVTEVPQFWATEVQQPAPPQKTHFLRVIPTLTLF